ncbi:magnesium transporter [Nocardioides mesophilus]|uniref:CBS domain-containing protein n=1 Tax=Nocardioides mesophilus TaxID=433659 RepID=A0A7G9R811_9ACTN|nr:CBS domain-containing protein [Nocardioides mesophilus]QNN51736.1 CBS domain-containing protein [Nocardioides mesophilus]
MSTSSTRAVFAARLAGLPVFDPAGDQVGKIRDLVAVLRPGGLQPRVLGLVVEVFGRRSIFVPMTRVTSVDSGQVITTGLVNMRRFEQRPTETLVLGQMLDRMVTVRETGAAGTVYDVAMEQVRNRDWVISRVALQEGAKRFGRRGQTHVVEWRDIDGFAVPEERQGTTHLLAALDEMRPADLASVLHDLPAKRRGEIAAALNDERLADVLEELPEEDQVEILGNLGNERAADVLEEMSPDDAADLIAELPPETAEQLLQLMDPEEAEDVRRLMSYEERTAGGMMTTEPVILPPDATIADALAHVRQAELSPSLAALVYVVRPPLEPPTGRLIGVAHIQRLLREPPSSLVGAALDTDVEGLRPEATLEEVARHLATYNLVSAPVVDDDNRLLGAVTVDDLLDHLLPENWRETPSRTAGGPLGRVGLRTDRG